MSSQRLLDDVRARMASGEVETWADGYGRWYARVRTSYAAPKVVARAAVWIELRDRGDTRTHVVPKPDLERAPEYDVPATDVEPVGRVTYRERARDD